MNPRHFVVPGTDVTVILGDDLIIFQGSDVSLYLTPAQVAYVLQEYGPFKAVTDTHTWRGMEGSG